MNEIIHRVRDLGVGRRAEELAGGFERIAALSRRHVLKKGLAAAAGVALASAGLLGVTRTASADVAVKTGKFIFPRLKFSVSDETRDQWNTGLIGDAILRKHLRQLTKINMSDEPKVVRLADFEDLCQNPFVFMTSEGYFKLPDNEEKNLREFLERGGFVHADDCVYTHGGRAEDRFYRDYIKMINRLFPDNPMRKVPDDHEIYHVYYDFPSGCPHMQGEDKDVMGLFEPGTGRIMTLDTPGDLHCGWMDEYWPHEKNMQAIKMGVNIVIYFLSH